jgi:hypothetical protein
MKYRAAALAVLVPISLAACAPATNTGVVVGGDGVGVRTQTDRVSAAIGPDDAAVVVEGDRVVAGADSDEVAVGVPIGGGAMVGGRRQQGSGTFGGVGFGF